MRADFVLGFVAMVLALVYLALARSIPPSLLDDVVGPRGLPILLGLAMAVLAAAQLVRARLAKRASTTPDAASGAGMLNAPTVVTFGCGLLYAVLLPVLGYPCSIAVLLAAVAGYHGGGLTSRVAVVSVGGALAFWALFVRILGIPQPTGIWPTLF